MKALKITAILLALGVLFQLSAYINRMMSFKYEVELMRTVVGEEKSKEVKEQDLKKIELKEKELRYQGKMNLILLSVLLFALVVNLYFLYKKYNSESSKDSSSG